MDPAILKRLEERALRARGPAGVLQLIQEAHPIDQELSLKESCDHPALRTVLRHAAAVNREVVKRAWSTYVPACTHLLQNPALSAGHARWLLEASLEQLRRGGGPFHSRQHEAWQVLAEGYRTGRLAWADPLSEELHRLLKQALEQAEAGRVPSSGVSAASALVACPDLPPLVIRQVAEALRRTQLSFLFRQAVQHPNADLALWRALARHVVRGEKHDLPVLLAEVPAARRDPEVRSALLRVHNRVDVLPLLCLDAGPWTPRFLAHLAEHAPHRLVDVLTHPEFESLRTLDLSDLLLFFDHPSPEVRMAAMRAAARLQLLKAEALSAEVTPEETVQNSGSRPLSR